MALSTYTELQAAIASWAAKNNLTTFIPDFIALAEARMSSDLATKALERVQDATITAGSAPLPADVIDVRGLRIVAATIPDLEVTSRERLDELRRASYAGNRIYAALVGRDVKIFPTQTGTLEVFAKCRVPALSASPTNWLLTNFPNAYLFGSLMEVADFNKDAAGFAQWERRYNEAIGQANQAFVYRGQMAASVVHGVR